MTIKRIFRIIFGLLLLFVFAAYLFMYLPEMVWSRDGFENPQASAPAVSTPAPEDSQTPEASPEVSAEPVASEAPVVEDPKADLPDVDLESWELVLVNLDNPIGEYAPSIETLEGQQFDSRIIDAMKEFVAAARAEGLNVYLSSGYRDYATQQYLYNRKVAQYGEETAKTIVAPPGTSEHQTGLSCDITDRYYEVKDESLENTAMYQWMSQHCQEYGFIVRFPKDKTEITGIMYEPWHFRYVGVEAATYIMENGLCLEEFVELYNEA